MAEIFAKRREKEQAALRAGAESNPVNGNGNDGGRGVKKVLVLPRFFFPLPAAARLPPVASPPAGGGGGESKSTVSSEEQAAAFALATREKTSVGRTNKNRIEWREFNFGPNTRTGGLQLSASRTQPLLPSALPVVSPENLP